MTKKEDKKVHANRIAELLLPMMHDDITHLVRTGGPNHDLVITFCGLRSRLRDDLKTEPDEQLESCPVCLKKFWAEQHSTI